MKKVITVAIILSLAVFAKTSHAQKFAVKTNLLYGATLTPNLGVEIGLGKKTTLELSAGYNPWNLDGDNNDNKKLVHLLGHAEFRMWTCQKFNGHFFGIHALGSEYNIGRQDQLPGVFDYIFEDNSRDYRFEGYAAGGGISYGYQWILGSRWSLEATIGVGAVYMNYDKYQCPLCGDKIDSNSKIYLGPTKAGFKVVYIIK